MLLFLLPICLGSLFLFALYTMFHFPGVIDFLGALSLPLKCKRLQPLVQKSYLLCLEVFFTG